MSKTIIEALKEHDLVIRSDDADRWMFWDGEWKVFEYHYESELPQLIATTQDEKEAIEALVSED